MEDLSRGTVRLICVARDRDGSARNGREVGLRFGLLHATKLRDRVVELVLKKEIAQRHGSFGWISIHTCACSCCSVARRQLIGANPAMLTVERPPLRCAVSA